MKNALFSPLFRPHQPRARPFSFPVILLPFSFSLPSLGSRPLLLLLEPKNCIFVVCFAPPKSVLVNSVLLFGRQSCCVEKQNPFFAICQGFICYFLLKVWFLFLVGLLVEQREAIFSYLLSSMAISLRYGSYFYGDYQVGTERKEIGVGSVEVLGGKNEFKGRQIVVKNQSSSDGWNPKGHSHCSIHASNCLPRAMKWWEKSIIPNMTEITSSDHLVESLATAGDKLVIVDFYSPGCGGCKALHPKICQLAESYPDAIFLKVNYEEHKSMCHSLRIHVLPFFRLYRGAQGRVCSFSCTNATVKKLKDAMAKHGTERCSLGPAKGLEEEELLVLASNSGARFNRPPALSSI
ncbi:unnamed protein product [Musa acuminata subsp. burmannicoides]